MVLLSAAEAGDQTQQATLSALVKEIENNSAITEHERFVVASRARGLQVMRTKGIDRTARLAAYAQLARDLIASFPEESEPYESLLALANDNPDAVAGAQLAREILNLPLAPAEVKTGAQTLLARQALVGQPLAFSFKNDAGEVVDLTQFRGKVVVLYAWTAHASNSHLWVRSLLQQGTKDVVFIGFNFDRDRLAALTKATEINPDALQIYSPDGLAGPVARSLHISRIPCIYLVDRTGVVRSVNVWKDLPKELAQLLAEGGRS